MRDLIVPGGVSCDLYGPAAMAVRRQCDALQHELRILRDIYDEHAGLQDRFRTCGRVTRDLATQLGLTGFAARASGVPEDLRCDFRMPPYDVLEVRRVMHADGDVAARVAVRFDEVAESLRLIRIMLDSIPDGEVTVALPGSMGSRLALGCVEGWRGPVLIALEAGPHGSIRRCHP